MVLLLEILEGHLIFEEEVRGLHPFFVGLHHQGADEPQTRGVIWKYTHNACPTLEFLVVSFEHVRGAHP